MRTPESALYALRAYYGRIYIYIDIYIHTMDVGAEERTARVREREGRSVTGYMHQERRG